MLQVLHDQAREVDVDGGGPLGRSVPLVRAGSKAGAVAPHMHAKAHVYRCSRWGRAGSSSAWTRAVRRQQQQRAGGWAGAACMRCGPAQAKWEAKARCRRPFWWPHTSREVRRLRRFPTACRGSASGAWTRPSGWMSRSDVWTLVFPRDNL
jgi:hypothetical protein